MATKLKQSVIPGSTVLITGAARGMGELYARRAAREGARAIALWDVDEERAEALAAELNNAHGSGQRGWALMSARTLSTSQTARPCGRPPSAPAPKLASPT